MNERKRIAERILVRSRKRRRLMKGRGWKKYKHLFANIKQLGLSRTSLSKQYIMGFCMIIIIIIIILYRKLYIEPPLWAKPF